MKKKQFMSKLAALTMAAAMGLTAVPATALNVMAATAAPVSGSATQKEKDMAAAIQAALKDITIANDAAGTALESGVDSSTPATLESAGLDKVADAVKGKDTTATVSFGSTSYTVGANKLTTVATVANATDSDYNKGYNITIDATVESESTVETALKALDLTYNTTLSQAQNEYNVKQAAKDAVAAVDSRLVVGNVAYVAPNANTDTPASYTINVKGTLKDADGHDVTLGSNDAADVTFTLAATSKDANVLDSVVKALASYKSASTDAAVTEEQVTDEIQAILDGNDDFSGVTFAINNFKKTDDKVTADVVLTQGDATKTVKLNKAIDKTALADTALAGITFDNLKTSAEYNFTKDTDGVATGLDSDALASAVKKAAEANLKASGYTNAVANVTINTYEADTTTGNSYAAGTVTVTRNGETSASKIFTINCDVVNGAYSYTTSAAPGAVGVVRNNAVLKKSDNQKIASVVAALDKAVKKDATLGIKNTANKNVPLTKNDVLTKAKTNPKITAVGAEGVALKYKVSEDGKTVTVGTTGDKAIVVKSYTAPTTEAEGTAVITVNYNILMDGKTSGSTTASDYVSASHDITLTFPKLSARKTSSIDVEDSTSKIELTLNATDTTDAKDYFNFNGNSALTWTSSDPSIFTVDADGNLVPVGIGEATLTVAVADNASVKATKTVKVSGTTAFKDVQNPNAWYYWSIYTLANLKNAKGNAIVQGIAKDEFGVSAPITRAQFVTFLYRLADEPVVSTATSFSDVSSSASYAKAVAWAAQKGIINGKTDTTFAPNDTVTRAEAVTMLYRYNGKPAYNSDITTAFSDVASSAYYYDAVQWAKGRGITKGKTSSAFAPNDTCTRAEGITMIANGR